MCARKRSSAVHRIARAASFRRRWVRDALHASHADERREHEEAIQRHQAEYKRLDERIHAMYVYKLDGLVDAAFFERMSNQWREEQNRCLSEIERLQAADRSYMGEGAQLLELARNAQRLFAKQDARKTSAARFHAVELLLGGWRSGCHLPATV